MAAGGVPSLITPIYPQYCFHPLPNIALPPSSILFAGIDTNADTQTHTHTHSQKRKQIPNEIPIKSACSIWSRLHAEPSWLY